MRRYRRAQQGKEQNMTHIVERQEQPLSVVASLRGILGGWRKDLQRHRAFERTYAELASLTDRELSDIGIGRSQIVDLAWDAAKRA